LCHNATELTHFHLRNDFTNDQVLQLLGALNGHSNLIELQIG
jgi:hypothetical protein